MGEADSENNVEPEGGGEQTETTGSTSESACLGQ